MSVVEIFSAAPPSSNIFPNMAPRQIISARPPSVLPTPCSIDLSRLAGCMPQAKTYDACAALGPCIYVPGKPIDSNTMIHLLINRQNQKVFEGSIAINQMRRSLEELVSFVYRECSFPKGCLVMTGTGIVPGHDFTLQSGDEIQISIDNIGTLINTVR